MSDKISEVINLAKTRGFIFPSSEIYNGFAGVYDYGPMGVELQNNIKKKWWQQMVSSNSDIVGLDSAIFMDPKIWEASGHTTGFADPVVVSNKTGKRYRADHLLEQIGVDADERMDIEDITKLFNDNKDKIKLENEDAGNLSDPVFQNLLVKSNINSSDTGDAYLRGETCQGIYVNYKNVVDSMHLHIPFGISQIGKAFRNEISPRQFIFRLREFQQMEMQYFCHASDTAKYFDKFKSYRKDCIVACGIKEENLRFVEHKRLVFYASAAVDIEYKYPTGWKELEGIHDRGNYDLTQHSKYSGKKLEYFDEQTQERYIPSVVETSIGLERLFLAILCDAYEVEKLPDGTERTVLKLQNDIAPNFIAILPLMKKKDLKSKAIEVFDALKKDFACAYDETQTIGKRYRRQDEIGTPYCVTIDYDTLSDGTVTIRNRDTMKQDRVSIDDLSAFFFKKKRSL